MMLLQPRPQQDDTCIRRAIADKLAAVFGRTLACRKVLLIKPLSVNESDFSCWLASKRRYYNYPPYGLALLAAQLKQRGYAVTIVDLNMDVLRAARTWQDRTDGQARVAHLWQDRLQKVMVQCDPDVVGITCTFTMSHAMMIRVADIIKSCRPKVPVVAGGVHVTASPDVVLMQADSIDFLCLYEGDKSFCDMLDVANGRRGQEALSQLATKVDGRVVKMTDPHLPGTETIDTCPDYGALPLEQYRDMGEIGAFRYWMGPETRAGIVQSNRGCRGRCAFCTVWRFHRRRVRCRSVDAVVDEIAWLKDRYGITHITWLDDDLFYDSRRALRLFKEITRRKLDITWDASNGVITSSVARCPELIDAAVASGCIGIILGIESGSPDILRDMRKPSTVEDSLKAAEILQAFPQVFTRGFLIVGFPHETFGQIHQTISLARQMNLDWYTVSLLTPLPSTEVYDALVAEGVIQGVVPETEGGFDDLLGYVGYGYTVRHGEDRRAIETNPCCRETAFVFKDVDAVPTREELNDVWLIVDYKVNYEKILSERQPDKLKKMWCFLSDVSQRMTERHPLAHLFLAIVQQRLGQHQEVKQHLALSRQYVQASAYWQRFYAALSLEWLYAPDINIEMLEQKTYPAPHPEVIALSSQGT